MNNEYFLFFSYFYRQLFALWTAAAFLRTFLCSVLFLFIFVFCTSSSRVHLFIFYIFLYMEVQGGIEDEGRVHHLLPLSVFGRRTSLILSILMLVIYAPCAVARTVPAGYFVVYRQI